MGGGRQALAAKPCDELLFANSLEIKWKLGGEHNIGINDFSIWIRIGTPFVSTSASPCVYDGSTPAMG